LNESSLNSVTENTTPTTALNPSLSSVLLQPYSKQLVYAFTGKEVPLGGQALSEAQRQAYRQQWCEQLGLDARLLKVPQQNHGTQCQLSTASDLTQTDALIVESPKQPVLIQTADCVPVLLYAPSIPLVVAIHAGWRGTAAGICLEVLKMLKQRYNLLPADVIAVLGPSIGLQAYEVGDEVVLALKQSLPEHSPMEQWVERLPKQKQTVDVAEVNKLQLLAAGVESIERLAYCTFTLEQEFWSHRRGDWQRQGLLVALKE
jgi:polyphenol oxidase